MRIVLLGAPGSGKGTHASYLKNHLNIPHISTGAIFREDIAKNTELGKLANKYISKGQLVPDDVTIELVRNRLSKDDCKNGYILDGCPRTLLQAYELDKFIELDLVLYLDLSLDTALSRMLNRRVCQSCKTIYNLLTYNKSECEKCGGKLVVRQDDKKETIVKRFDVYKATTYPLIEYYKNKNLLYSVDASKDIKDIQNVILKIVGEVDERNN